MRPVRVAGLFLVIVFLGGALIAPWVFGMAQFCNGVFPGLHLAGTKHFPRYLNRSLLILALIGLWWFLRAADLRSWRAVGLGRRSDSLYQVTWGFALGLMSLAGVVFISLSMGARQVTPGHSVSDLLKHMATATLTALVVAPIEEVFFRGALFGTLRKTFHWTMALVLSSAIYALLHFLERPAFAGPVVWSSGLVVLGEMLAGMTAAEKMIPGFLNLTVAGIILGFSFQRTGSLYFSMGLHAGWIFWLKTYGFITNETPGSNTWFFGTSKLINGWLALLVLGAFLFVLSRMMREDVSQTGWKERRLFR